MKKISELHMPSIGQNIVNRVSKLPKPHTHAQGLQPLFEAISNGLYAIAEKMEQQSYDGTLNIEIENLNSPRDIIITVTDNGIGLGDERYEAFQQTDTEYRVKTGGKGVGRLFWLDAFNEIKISSRFENDGINRRDFFFRLKNEEQIEESDNNLLTLPTHGTGTSIQFTGLRGVKYQNNFPKSPGKLNEYFAAHFIAELLLARTPPIRIIIDGETTVYPKAISGLVEDTLEAIEFEQSETKFTINGFICHREVNKGLSGLHQLHFLADNRNVVTREIDGLIGAFPIERDGVSNLVFHGCVKSDYLDTQVNESRTGFNLDSDEIKKLTRELAGEVRSSFLEKESSKHAKKRKEAFEDFLQRYPTYYYDDFDRLLEKVGHNDMKPEEFAPRLAKVQVRRDEERQKKLSEIIATLNNEKSFEDSFTEAVQRAADDIQETEHKALAQHVARRKLVLELLEVLIKRIRKNNLEDRKDDHHIEATLHTLICPMKVFSNNPEHIEASQHDLWVLDERLAYTQAFSSDQRFKDILKDSQNQDRADLILWNYASGLGVIADGAENADISDPIHRMMVVEFKRPGRTRYSTAEDNIEQQVLKYLRELKDGRIESFDRKTVRIADHCVFDCFVIADIEGDLKNQLAGWQHTRGNQGRYRPLSGNFEGSSIEVIQWQDLASDAWVRNRSTLAAGGVRRDSNKKSL